MSDPASGRTLEPQVVLANETEVLQSVLGRTDKAELTTWMTNNKTKAALAIFDSDTPISYPLVYT